MESVEAIIMIWNNKYGSEFWKTRVTKYKEESLRLILICKLFFYDSFGNYEFYSKLTSNIVLLTQHLIFILLQKQNISFYHNNKSFTHNFLLYYSSSFTESKSLRSSFSEGFNQSTFSDCDEVPLNLIIRFMLALTFSNSVIIRTAFWNEIKSPRIRTETGVTYYTYQLTYLNFLSKSYFIFWWN